MSFENNIQSIDEAKENNELKVKEQELEKEILELDKKLTFFSQTSQIPADNINTQDEPDIPYY